MTKIYCGPEKILLYTNQGDLSGRKEGDKIFLSVFSDTYDWVRTLQQDPPVYEVRHKGLGEHRVLKMFPKDRGDSSGFQREAEILKGLRHPGIPILYDYGEDDTWICLLEELVPGHSLRQDLSSRLFPGEEELVSILIRVCEILEYLHTREIPVLHGDLKPEHIIVSQDRICLIDYGIARFQARSGEVSQVFGTPGYVPPEALDLGRYDERSDLYSLGVIGKELSGPHLLSPPLLSLLKALTARDPGKRPATAGEVLKRLHRIKGRKESGGIRSFLRRRSGHKPEQDLPETIAVIGSEEGAGCTHISIALCEYLNRAGYRAYYETLPGEDVLESLMENASGTEERNGLIYHGHFRGRLMRKGVPDDLPPEGICILDAKTDSSLLYRADVILYVFPSCLWRRVHTDGEILSRPNVLCLVNPADRAQGNFLSRQLGRPVLGYPREENPFLTNRRKEAVFQRILKEASKQIEKITPS